MTTCNGNCARCCCCGSKQLREMPGYWEDITNPSRAEKATIRWNFDGELFDGVFLIWFESILRSLTALLARLIEFAWSSIDWAMSTMAATAAVRFASDPGSQHRGFGPLMESAVQTLLLDRTELMRFSIVYLLGFATLR